MVVSVFKLVLNIASMLTHWIITTSAAFDNDVTIHLKRWWMILALF